MSDIISFSNYWRSVFSINPWLSRFYSEHFTGQDWEDVLPCGLLKYSHQLFKKNPITSFGFSDTVKISVSIVSIIQEEHFKMFYCLVTTPTCLCP